ACPLQVGRHSDLALKLAVGDFELVAAATLLQAPVTTTAAHLEPIVVHGQLHVLGLDAGEVKLDKPTSGHPVNIGIGLPALRQGLAPRRQGALKETDKMTRHEKRHPFLFGCSRCSSRPRPARPRTAKRASSPPNA